MAKQLGVVTVGPAVAVPLSEDWTLDSQAKKPLPVTLQNSAAVTADDKIDLAKFFAFSVPGDAIDTIFKNALQDVQLGKTAKIILGNFNSATLSLTQYTVDVTRDVNSGNTIAKALTTNGVVAGIGTATGLTVGSIVQAVAGAGAVAGSATAWPVIVIAAGATLAVGFAFEASGLNNNLKQATTDIYNYVVNSIGGSAVTPINIGASDFNNAKTHGLNIIDKTTSNFYEHIYVPNAAGNNNITLKSGIYAVHSESDTGNDIFQRSGNLSVNAQDQKHSIIDGGTGQDTISYQQVSNLTGGIEIALQDGGLNHGVSTPRGVDYGIPLDLLDFIEHAVGTNYNDSIIGSDGGNNLKGANGSDTIIGGKGSDTLIGGVSQTDLTDTGTDVVDYSNAAAGINADFSKKTAQIIDGDGGTDSIYSIEKIIGSGKDDRLYYNAAIQSVSKVTLFDSAAGIDTVDFSKATAAITYTLNGKIGAVETDNFENIIGSAQADKLTGDAKGNIIFSGGGNDTLAGGAGADVFNITGTGTVTINDNGKGDFLAIENKLIYGAASKNGTTYNLNGYTLQKVGADLTVTGDVGTITLKNWVEGDYNISLQDAPGVTLLYSPCGTFIYPGDSYGAQQAALNVAYQILGLYTPLVIDLNKSGGIELTEIYSSNARFDIDADGYAEHSGWIKPTDGFLVVDKNGNGVIDNQTEMFGADASSTAWAKLKAYDSNNDGKVTSADANWAKLKVWKDLDQDQWTDAGELFAPTAVGVYGLKYAKEAFSRSASEATGFNAIDGRAAFLNSTGGNAGYMYDVLFTADDRNTVYVGTNLKAQPATDFASLMAYPQYEGQGNVLPLHQAVAGNAALQNALKAFMALPTGTYSHKLDAPLINILKAWGNIGATANEHELKRAILTVFDGSIKTSPGVIQNPWQTAYDVLPQSVEDQFGILMDELRTSLMPQGSYKKFFTNGYYSFADNLYHINDSLEAIITRAKPSQPTDAIEKSFFWSGLFKVLSYATDYTLGGSSSVNLSVIKDYIKSATGTDVIIATHYGRVADNESVYDEYQYPHNSYWIGSNGNNTISGSSLESTIYGNGGDDSISGGGLLFGGDGNDTLLASGNTESLSGGKGNNTFYGYKLSDAAITFILAKDTIAVTDTIYNFKPSNSDIPDKIDLTAFGTNLTLGLMRELNDTAFVVGNHKVVIKNVTPDAFQLANFIGVANISNAISAIPSDGPDSISGSANADTINGLWGNDTILGNGGNDSLFGDYGNDSLLGGAGDDTLNGSVNEDVLIGGLGNDLMIGASESDRFIINQGDGNDTINDYYGFYDINGIDTVAFGTGISFAGLGLTRSGDNLLVTFTGGNQVTIINQFNRGAMRIETFSFSDETNKSWLDIQNAVIAKQITVGNDSIQGFEDADTINTLAGNDTIKSGAGDDSLTGGIGNDSIEASSGNDTIIINQGDGLDTIWGGGDNDTLLFGTGITYSGLQFIRPATVNDLQIAVPGGGMVYIQDAFDTYSGIENFKFVDGSVKSLTDVQLRMIAEKSTAGNDTVIGFDTADSINAAAGNDSITAFNGNDTITGGLGNDTIIAGNDNDLVIIQQGHGIDSINAGYGTDVLSFNDSGITWANLTLTRSGVNDLQIGVPGGSIFVKDEFYSTSGFETFKFFDNSTKTIEDIKVRLITQSSTAGNDTILGFDDRNDIISGAAGNDSITGYSGADTINGGLGADTLTGFGGADVFDYNTLAESSKTVTDFINDFDTAADVIDVRGLGFTGIAAGAASGTKLGFTYDAATTDTIIVGVSDFKIILDGNKALDASDFIFA